MLFAFHLQPAPGLEDLARAALPGLAAVSAERQRDELCRLLALPEPHQVLTYVRAWDALPLLMPELVALQGVEQTPPHTYDAYEHTLVALRWMARIDRLLRQELQPSDEIEVALAAGLAPLASRLRAYLEVELSAGRPRWLGPSASPPWPMIGARPLPAVWLPLMAVCLPPPWTPGTVSISTATKWSAPAWQRLGSTVFTSLRVRSTSFGMCVVDTCGLCTSHKERGTPSRRSLYRLYRDFGGDTPALALLYAADTLATYGPDIDRDIWRQHVGFIAALLKPAYGETQR